MEVTSHSDPKSELAEKVEAWLNAGCLVVVGLDPERQTASVYRAGHDVRSLNVTDELSLPDLLPVGQCRSKSCSANATDDTDTLLVQFAGYSCRPMADTFFVSRIEE